MRAQFAVMSAAALLTALVAMTITALISRRVGKVAIVDVTWGLVFVAIAWVLAALSMSSRSVVLAVLVTVWGGRLAWHIRRRAVGAGEDPRYTELLRKAPEGNRFGYAVRKVFLTQGFAAYLISLPLQVSASVGGALGWIGVAGIALSLTGVLFESIGDAQLAKFKADPANQGKIMDQGLWGWTRHPNYFGDSLVWWGIWLIAAEVWPGVLTVVSPLVMTYFLVFATGAKLQEREMAKRPGYREYMQRTSGFIPRPPKAA